MTLPPPRTRSDPLLLIRPPGLTDTLERLNAAVQGGTPARTAAPAPVIHQHITAAPNQSPEHIGALAGANTQWALMTTRAG